MLPKLEFSNEELRLQESVRKAIDHEMSLSESAKKVKRATHSLSLSVDELSQFDGSDPNLPIYLSLRRRLFDVTDSAKYYSKGQKYDYLAGKEIARGLATGCLETSGLTSDLRGLTEDQLDIVEGWGQFYKNKYRLVGYLQQRINPHSPVPNDDCEEANKYGGRPAV